MRIITVVLFILFTSNVFAQTAKAKFFIGEVRVKKATEQGTWKNLTLKTELENKDLIRTGEKSRCEILLPDGSITYISENSMLELRNISNPETSGIEIFTGFGKFLFKVKKIISGNFRVGSPAAVVAIRGTEFILINEGGQTELMVKSGVVDFSDPALVTTLQVQTGQKSVTIAGEAPQTPMVLSEKDLDLFDEMTSQPEEMNQDSPETEETAKPATKEINQEPQPSTGDDAQKPDKRSSDGPGFSAGVSVGAVLIDDQIYNQIGIRPEFSIGKLGVALDLSLYMDKDGNIRDENWDEFSDIFEKIYYVRWGQKGDPFYVKAGAIDNYRLGYGLLMNHYSNTIEYPTVIRTGMELGLQGDKFGFEGMVNDFGELSDGGGLTAGRVTYKILGDLEIGASVVYDVNQYKSLKDRDGDGIPDYIDDLPDDKKYSVDTDGDGVPDALDPDRDGNGYSDNYAVLPDSSYYNDDQFNEGKLKKTPFDVDDADNKSQIGFALDIAYPWINFDYLKLITYGQVAKFGNDGGWGIAAPGVMAKFAFINAYAEYRIYDEKFIPEYFNTTYELERAVFTTDSTGQLVPYTKRQLLESLNDKATGFVVGADFDILSLMIFGAEYQHMNKSEIEFKTFRANLDLNTSFLPKINRAGAYYIQNNVVDLFEKSPGTILGYRFEYEISGNASLLLDFRQNYRDLNGDGKISGSNETVRTTNVQTVFRF
ncbi:MAG: FecR domain-containing protein [Calditrichaceae bacterium]